MFRRQLLSVWAVSFFSWEEGVEVDVPGKI